MNDGPTPKTVKVSTDTGVEFDAIVRIDTPGEANYFRNGGILQYVLRNMRKS
jgi:aconitate hydratase